MSYLTGKIPKIPNFNENLYICTFVHMDLQYTIEKTNHLFNFIEIFRNISFCYFVIKFEHNKQEIKQ